MVSLWYFNGIYIRATTEGNTRQKEFSHRFSWGSLDFCLLLQIELIISGKMNREPKIVPLCDAVLFNNIDMFQQLINEGVDVNERDYNNLTALWYAAQEGRYEMARILIEHKADLEVKDKYGNTPLSKAVYWYKEVPDGKLIKLLVDAGADVNSENNYGVSPLGLAKTIGDFPYLDILEKK